MFTFLFWKRHVCFKRIFYLSRTPQWFILFLRKLVGRSVLMLVLVSGEMKQISEKQTNWHLLSLWHVGQRVLADQRGGGVAFEPSHGAHFLHLNQVPVHSRVSLIIGGTPSQWDGRLGGFRDPRVLRATRRIWPGQKESYGLMDPTVNVKWIKTFFDTWQSAISFGCCWSLTNGIWCHSWFRGQTWFA